MWGDRPLYVTVDAKTERISSYDRTGGNRDYITVPARAREVIAQIEGPAVIRHIWITVNTEDPLFRRHVILRFYWDDEASPSVEAPLGDFFGQGWGEAYNFASALLAAAPVGGRALNAFFPMPFARRARVELENDSEHPLKALYFYIDFERVGELPLEAAYFHAWWHRELTVPAEGVENEWGLLGPEPKNPGTAHNFVFVDAVGRGHVIGLNYFVDCPSPIWYGEGDDMWLIDGEPWPGSLHGTGTEDFFNSSWCPKEIYQHPLFGWARVNGETGWLGRTHAYRFFLEAPIRFSRSIHGSIEHGHANVLTLDLASVCYWYQTEPHKPFPPLPDRAGREPMPPIGPREIHRWRDAWREKFGRRAVWGHELP